MQLGMIGLGRMGANMVRRLLKAGHECADVGTSENKFGFEPDRVVAVAKEILGSRQAD